jgi:hypothetical protein
MYRIIFSTTLFLIFCSSVFQGQVNETPVITLEDGGYYRLSLFPDGTVIFIGMDNVLFEHDTEKTHIPSDSITSLLDDAKRIGFEHFKDHYCDCDSINDSTISITYYYPSHATRTTVAIDGNTKEVFEEGKPPKALTAFEGHIECVTHAYRWIGFLPDRIVRVDWRKLSYLPIYDTLVRLRHELDSIDIAEGNYGVLKSGSKADSVNKIWHHFADLATTPIRDSILRARQAIYRSLTDGEVDSIWWARYGP